MSKKQKKANSEKGGKVGLIIALVIGLPALLTSIILLLAMQKSKIIDVPAFEKALSVLGLSGKTSTKTDDEKPAATPEPPKVPEVPVVDADEYYNDNSTVISVVSAETSPLVHTESEAIAAFKERGFENYPVTAYYDMSGEFDDSIELSESSTVKHPMYEVTFRTESGNIWTVYDINGSFFAYPASYNYASENEAKVIVSESERTISYDGVTNRFYETIPNSSVMIVKAVDRINAETLEAFDNGGLD